MPGFVSVIIGILLFSILIFVHELGHFLAAKASDKLLSIKDVKAAFALILIGNTVHISARSDGSINVQLIAERLGGGGHFDMAGAQMRGVSVSEANEQLKGAIDDYYEYDYVPGNNATNNQNT